MALHGFLETLKHFCGGSEYPWFLHRIARSSIGPIFRVQLAPFAGLATKQFCLTADPQLARAVLKDPLNIKSKDVYGIFEHLAGGSSIFTSEGERWHHARKAVAPAFSSKCVANIQRVVQEQMDQWMKSVLIPKYVDQNLPFDVAEELMRQMLQGISIAGFQYKMSENEVDMFLREAHIMFSMDEIVINPFKLLFGLFSTTIKDQQKIVAKDRLRGFAHTVLQHYRRSSDDHSCQDIGTIVSMIDQNGNYESDEERITDIIAFYIAGHDTTACSLAWILLELAKNPTEQNKLRSALLKVPLTKRHTITELQCAVKEGLRLHPVGADGGWRLLHKDLSTDSYLLPKGTNVGILTLSMHRNPEYFDRPDEFLPSRWLNSSAGVNEAMSLAFMPFSLGRRNCVGQSLAYCELYNCLAKLISCFEFHVVDEGKADYFLILKPVGAKLIARKV